MHMRGQGASEYLVLIAIALIIALIAIVLLGGFTSTGSAAMDSESKNYWAMTRPFGITSWQQVNDTMYLSVVNRGTNQLVMRQIKIGNITADFGPGWSWKPGGEKNVSIPGLPDCTRGMRDAFSYNVTFNYDSFDLPGQGQTGSKKLAGNCVFP